MNDGQALLAAVIAEPEDDAVRLVYADWLDEHGDAARAEFIRTQIKREGLRKRDPERAVLEAREKELLGRHAQQWLQPLPEWARPHEEIPLATDWDWFGFKRGFLQGVCTGSVTTFLRDVKAVFATEPITHLYLGEFTAVARLAKSAEFMRLVGLRFGHYTLGDRGTTALCNLPPMPRLRQLWMYKQEMGDAGLKALARWPGLATVQELDLGFNDFKAPGIKALIASKYLTSLKRLDLQDSLIADKTKAALKERFGKVVVL
jgi:uncharacterized protein (TIGR02996 family)